VNERVFFWTLPVMIAASIALQLHYGRLGLLNAPKKEWLNVERKSDPGRFWLLIVAEALTFFILVGQAISQ
jgi:hypothetical protein